LEYFVGAAITLVTIWVANKFLDKKIEPVENLTTIQYSQSHVYELMRPWLPDMPPPEIGPTQSMNFLKQTYMKIMVVNNKAYWIKDNGVFVADVVDGEVNKENARKVDTMTMSKVELDEILFIIEKLREDEDDSRGTGKS
jgi:hypothetical protein